MLNENLSRVHRKVLEKNLYSCEGIKPKHLFMLKKVFSKCNTTQMLQVTVNSVDHYRAQNICPTGKLNCKPHCGKLLCCAPNSSYLSNCT